MKSTSYHRGACNPLYFRGLKKKSLAKKIKTRENSKLQYTFNVETGTYGASTELQSAINQQVSSKMYVTRCIYVLKRR